MPQSGYDNHKNSNAKLKIMKIRNRKSIQQQRAFTLVELMVAITLGLLLLAALLAVFLNVTNTNREMARTNILIENGRFAIQLLQNDLTHAGYWGELDYTGDDSTPSYAAPTAIPDPCQAAASWDTAYKDNLLSIPVQGYSDATGLSTCGVTGVLSTSDVLLVRHANTCTFGDANCNEGTDTGPHIQVSSCYSTVSPDPSRYVMAVASSSPSSATFSLHGKTCTGAPNAPLSKVISHFYYLAMNNNLPTLMRVSLENGVYSAPQPFIEGIEYFRVEFGIDENGKNGLPITSTNPGDGSADRFITTAELASAPSTACDVAGSRCFLQANTVAVKVHVLSRNLEPTRDYTDAKTYTLADTTVTFSNNDELKHFRRHVFSSTIRLVNPSARRESP